MTDLTPLERDLAARLDRAAAALAALIGLDIYDGLRPRIPIAAAALASQLVDDDRRLAAQTAIDLQGLVDLDDPADVASPVGIAVALTWAGDEVGVTDTARLLGVSRGRVYQLLDAGRLDRGADGGVTRASVARRLAGHSGP